MAGLLTDFRVPQPGTGAPRAFFAPDLERELIDKHIFGVPADKQPRWG